MEIIIEVIDWILRITGFITIILSILIFLLRKTEYHDDIQIRKVSESEVGDGVPIYDKYDDGYCPDEYTIFMPIGP